MLAHVCPECYRVLHSKRADAITCGSRCRQRAKRRRDAEALAARDALICDLIALHSATVREGMAQAELDRIVDDLHKLVSS